MQRTDFTQRAHRVLARKVAQKQDQERRGLRRLTGMVAALAAATACFFLLKAATLAHMGEERFLQATGAPASAAAQGGLGLWLTGMDPVTRVLSQAMTGARAQVTATDQRAGADL